ncbi:SRPBCC family protein [Arthrobacter sp. ISL-65]|uniref:SRPBCC family protein n=1 Tax=Arthrobacter sp. ISL-65 TaxID=2819112 RepID=UPI001BE769BE|nr:SRPBCC family protein [Arthrobacter sp. ISL-65]MBT2547197.1 SRPBCC family protein [Arthrobacter sp. ISL-65]
MQTAEETIDVAVPVRTAYDQWTQFESFPNFMSGVESVAQLDDRTNHWVANVGGAKREFNTEIIEQRPHERIAWRSTDGETHAGAVTFTPLKSGATRVWVRFEWAPETFTDKAGAVLGFDNMQVRVDLRHFKDFIEARGTETVTWRGEVH